MKEPKGEREGSPLAPKGRCQERYGSEAVPLAQCELPASHRAVEDTKRSPCENTKANCEWFPLEVTSG